MLNLNEHVSDEQIVLAMVSDKKSFLFSYIIGNTKAWLIPLV